MEGGDMDANAKYKVPFRQVWCPTIRSWVRETIWCHIVNRLFRYDIESLLPVGEGAPR